MPTLEFKGKQYIYSHHHSVPFRELVVDGKKSLPAGGKTPNLDDNLIIHGDNLHALKALMPQYAGKIKCIYIDPPYNTGNEDWRYNDNVNSPLMREWISKNANPVDKEDMQRHDKWLCMMYPRLKLLHELLADDGVIFVSIDDNEVHHLRAVMDEIWGEENFIGQFVVNVAPNARDYGHIGKMHEYALFYAKSIAETITEQLPEEDKQFRYTDENGGFNIHPLYNSNVAFTSKNRPNLYYPFYLYPNNRLPNDFYEISLEKRSGAIEIYPPKSQKDGVQFVWRWGKPKANQEINKEIVGYKTSDGDYRIVEKMRHSSKVIRSLQLGTEISSRRGTAEIEEIFNKKGFNFPKPKALIKDFIYASTDKNSIILDSFAGSGTTAHAVLDLNKEDGGNRKFILVEMEDYADSITAERVRRVIKGVPTAKDKKLKAGLGGSFTFCSLGDEFNIEKILTGETLPEYAALARYVFYTATGKSLEGNIKQKPDYFVGETDLYEVFLIYQPDLAFLRSNDSALNGKMVDIIKARPNKNNNSKKQKLVFASAKYMGQNELNEWNISFCQLPYAIHKVVGK